MPTRKQEKVVSLKEITVACQECSLNEICLPVGIDKNDMEQLDAIIDRKRPLARGDHLFKVGDRFRALYAVRSGSLKTFATSEDGQEQVMGFQLPGELVGLDAIAHNNHPLTARALETTSVCEIPFDQLEALSTQLPDLQRQMLRVMSQEIHDDEQSMLALGQRSAEERLAAFLISLSNRYRRRGFSSTQFNLTMSRGDIGNYLGLALETVSRLFTRFQNEGLLKVERRHIELLDRDRLCQFSSANCDADNPVSRT
ncbi:Crp/Fnr family transcriptional regulator [Thiogranum longum]|uniref:Crp/Fnr family transcriptional regulator n=1 Tax=Thiogranum longum TaxID=1537524 RepID=A0A4R1HGM0_9GAMM|nr:fumarate/nitrate reduction transcriptional regulator Fnr [Thiogranum longum]TCK19565.1 Crp/Fnr family transcriptional regulator [Thiogranum longum]